jgi:type I restriction enzyme, S subunit
MGPFGSDIKTENFVDTGVPVVRGVNLTDGFIEDGFVFVLEAKADRLRNANAFPETSSLPIGERSARWV